MATKTALNHTESQLQSLRTIHDVKFDKRSNSLLQRDGSEFGIRAADSGSMAVASNCTKDVKQKTHSSCHDHSMFAVCRLFIPFPSFPFPVKGSQILPGQCSIGHDGTHMYIYIYMFCARVSFSAQRESAVDGLWTGYCVPFQWSVGHWEDSQILWKFKGCLSDDCVGLAIEFEASSTWCRKHWKRSCAKSLTCLALTLSHINWYWIYIYINHIEASENPRPRSTLNAARKVAVLNGNQMQAPFAGTTAARLKMLCLKRTRTQENAGKWCWEQLGCMKF